MYRICLFISVMLICLGNARGGDFHISIFNEEPLAALVITAEEGKYIILGDDMPLGELLPGEIIYVSKDEDLLVMRNREGVLGRFAGVSMAGAEQNGSFSFRSVDPLLDRGYYNGSLYLSVNYGRISAINVIDGDVYLAGVVEAESGTGWHDMYYRAQSVICRTYLYGNLTRHADEGFHLCDGVHCQVYRGMLSGNNRIKESVRATENLVIVHGDSTLITAAFHSNCGGQTTGSGEVWLVHRPYLRPVTDPFCSGGRSSTWQRRISFIDWAGYLAGMGVDGVPVSSPASFGFSQHNRVANYTVGSMSLPFRKIREDWGLRSAFFDVVIQDNGRQVLIRGRGHGHGAGLCQEGAMEMAARGYNFIDILQFYYTDVKIKDIGDLK